MNRRNFLRNVLVAGASFAVLPPATTYSRIWKAERQIVNPDWVNAPFALTQILTTARKDFVNPCVFGSDYVPIGWIVPNTGELPLRYVIDPSTGFLRQVSKHL